MLPAAFYPAKLIVRGEVAENIHWTRIERGSSPATVYDLRPGRYRIAFRPARGLEVLVGVVDALPAVVTLCERVSLPWESSASELLVELDLEVKEKVRGSRAWPSSASALGNRLRRCAHVLRAIGIEVEFGGRAMTKDRKRLIVIRRRGE